MKILTAFHLSDLDCPDGATLVIRPLSKRDAQDIARARGAVHELINEPPRQLDRIIEALGLPIAPAGQISIGETVLVVEAIQWNNIRFFLVNFMATGNGEMPGPTEEDPFET